MNVHSVTAYKTNNRPRSGLGLVIHSSHQENKLICHPGDENHSDYNNYNFVGIILQIKTQTRKKAFHKPDTLVNKIKIHANEEQTFPNLKNKQLAQVRSI